MRTTFVFGALALVLSVGLAGCGAAPKEASGLLGLDADGVARFGAGAAGLRGRVMSTELAPIEGAQVTIAGFPAISTNDAGLFEAAGLEPGVVAVNVAAAGYGSLDQEVLLTADKVAEAEFVLTRLAVVEPFIEVLQFRGTSICDRMTLVITGRLSGPGCEGQRNRFEVNVTGDWKFLVLEQVWQATTGFNEWFRIFTGDDGDCTDGSPCYGLALGKGYARLEGEPGKTDLVTHYDPWMDGRGPPYPNETFTMQINSQWIGLFVEEVNSTPGEPCQIIFENVSGTRYRYGCVGVGVSTGVVFDLWASVFHNAGPADRGECCPATQYSALPDN